MFARYFLLAFIYLSARFIWPLRVHWAAKVAAVLLLLPISQYYYLVRNYFGSLASPELPFAVLAVWNWLFISMLLLAFITIARDAALVPLLVPRLFGKRVRFGWSRQRSALIMLTLALGLGGYGVWSAIRVPDVVKVEVSLEGLPKELDGFKLLHITDLHASALLPGWRVREVVDKANALEPDLVAFSGDLIDGSTAKRAKDVAPLAGLRAKYGVYACDGNHEYYSGYADWMKRFKELGITVLHNSHVLVPPKQPGLVLAGLDDRAPASAVRGALKGAPANLPRILLEHRPGQAPQNAKAGLALQLSGHTHGGQILLFDYFVAKRNNGFVRGWYKLGGMQLYVSPGAGLWGGFPVRLGVPSEITLMTLRSG